MKVLNSIALICVMALMAASASFAMTNDHHNMEAYSDKAFLSGMVVHHEAAVDMSKDALKNGKNAQVKKWAEEIITAQETEIKQMNEWLKSMGGKDEHAAKMMQDSMDSMMHGSTEKNADRMFVSMMIPHHAGAVEMSLDAIINSDNEKIVKLAGDIITAQLKEIIAYKKWLKNN